MEIDEDDMKNIFFKCLSGFSEIPLDLTRLTHELIVSVSKKSNKDKEKIARVLRDAIKKIKAI